MKDEEIEGLIAKHEALIKRVERNGIAVPEIVSESIDALRQLHDEVKALRDALEEATGWDWLTDPDEIPRSVVAEINTALSQDDK